MTFDQSAEGYILAHKAGWKNAKHRDQWANTLNTYASPVFGHLPVATIDTGLVVKCLAKIWDSKTEPRVACAGVSSPCWGGPPPRLPHRRESCTLERPSGEPARDHQQNEPDEERSVVTVAAHGRVHVGTAFA
jgi:hypothetical protein